MNQYYIVCKEEDKEAVEQKIAELGIQRERCANDANVAIVIGPDETRKTADGHVKNPDMLFAYALGMPVFRVGSPHFLNLTRENFDRLVSKETEQRYQRYAVYRNYGNGSSR